MRLNRYEVTVTTSTGRKVTTLRAANTKAVAKHVNAKFPGAQISIREI